MIDEQSNIVSKHIMPTKKALHGREIDIQALHKLFRDLKRSTFVVEDPGGHAPCAAGLRSMTFSYAVAITTLSILGIRHHIVRAVEWQRTHWKRPKLPKSEKFDTKAAALNAATRLWPNESWTKNERSKIPHDGLIDAALIAEHARKHNLEEHLCVVPELSPIDAALCCGYASAWDGYDMMSNPYKKDSTEHAEFIRGFRIGAREAMGRDQSVTTDQMLNTLRDQYQRMRKSVEALTVDKGNRIAAENEVNRMQALVNMFESFSKPEPEMEIEIEQLEVEL